MLGTYCRTISNPTIHAHTHTHNSLAICYRPIDSKRLKRIEEIFELFKSHIKQQFGLDHWDRRILLLIGLRVTQPIAGKTTESICYFSNWCMVGYVSAEDTQYIAAESRTSCYCILLLQLNSQSWCNFSAFTICSFSSSGCIFMQPPALFRCSCSFSVGFLLAYIYYSFTVCSSKYFETIFFCLSKLDRNSLFRRILCVCGSLLVVAVPLKMDDTWHSHFQLQPAAQYMCADLLLLLFFFASSLLFCSHKWNISFVLFLVLFLDFYVRFLFKIEMQREIHRKISNNGLWIEYGHTTMNIQIKYE